MNTQNAMSLYKLQMKEIVDRDSLLRQLFDGKRSLGLVSYDYEVFALNVRKILELIAFSSLVAARDQYSLKHKNFHDHYRSKKILDEIEKINPNFFPVPADIINNKDGSKHLLKSNNFQNALTRSEFETLYDKCSSVIHAWKPYNQKSREIDFEISPLSWLNKIRDLLNVHYVRLSDNQGFWLCQMRGSTNGEPDIYNLTPEDRDFTST